MEIRTRIAPSPTGSLHIGTARAALFNYLFARQNGGKFFLRIEDTDESRNSKESYDSITNGLSWLGLDWDGEIVYQSQRKDFYKSKVDELLQKGLAYCSFVTKEEMEARHAKAHAEGKSYIHRYSEGEENPVNGVEPAIRLRVESGIDIVNHDLIQGDVVINTDTIEDFVISRGDGTPLYVTSVVCDDIDMNITHVLRGVDHLTNTAKQMLLYKALGANVPLFGHIPLVYGDDGKKLSKRHGATSAAEYRDMGYLPQAMRSYLLRLGFGTDTDDVLDDKQALEVFDLSGVRRSPSQFDFAKLRSVNHHFIKDLPAAEVVKSIKSDFPNVTILDDALLLRICEVTKHRYYTLKEIADSLHYFTDPRKNVNAEHIKLFVEFLDSNSDDLHTKFKEFIASRGVKFGEIGPSIRLALAGEGCQIGIFEMVEIFGIQGAKSRVSELL